jgi:hypothetical protein
MDDTQTPGQIAYAAYRVWYMTADPTSEETWPTHAELEPHDRAAWEAAAQAVLARQEEKTP